MKEGWKETHDCPHTCIVCAQQANRLIQLMNLVFHTEGGTLGFPPQLEFPSPSHSPRLINGSTCVTVCVDYKRGEKVITDNYGGST